jgi:hypothetical protein
MVVNMDINVRANAKESVPVSPKSMGRVKEGAAAQVDALTATVQYQ